MAKKDKNTLKDQQLSIFDEFFENMKDFGGTLSVDEINAAIESLSDALTIAKHQRRELKRKEAEARKIEKEKLKKQAEAEHIQKVTSMDLPFDWNNIFNTDKRTEGVHTDSISDALIMSLNTLGCVDIEYISSITDQDYKTVINTLKGSIYQNPDTWNECFYKGWETADEYLSGNLMRKWKSAFEATKKYNGYFDDNLKAIEKILPPTVATKDIYITLGSPWVPTHIIDEFIEYLIGPHRSEHTYTMTNDEYNLCYSTRHDEITGTWEIPVKSRYNFTRFSFKTDNVYGTSRMNALHIIERTLNMKSVAIRDEVLCTTNKSGKKRVVNETETMLAIEKQKQIIKKFQKWVWEDDARKKELEEIFEANYSCVCARHFDGSFLEFPTMSKEVSLYPYQKNAVARILFSPNTLLAHDVGSGKTYVMIAAGMELRRMGISKKNLYVVPNNIVGQWENIFLTLYPDANILIVEPKKFTPEKREEILENIRDNDYDAVVMAYSCFEMIPLSFDYYEREINFQKEMIEKITKTKNKATSRLTRKSKELDKALESLKQSIHFFYDTIYFDELGINTLFVDEAHNFKNVPIDTKIANVLGINSKGSSKCQDMMDKVRCVQKQNDGRGVVLATGTPITNSITDIFVMQKYLQSGELALLDLQSFDSWIGMFAERKTEFEIDVDTNQYRLATRFAKFHNLPELTSLLSSIADFHSADGSAGIPQFDGYKDMLMGKTPQLEYYLKQISSRAETVRARLVPRYEDNMLKITTDGRKAALDLRLVDNSATFTFQSKVASCAENIFYIYQKTFLDKGTQLVFCDTSTPKKGFNIYDELSALLMNMGIPQEKIAYIHDATTEKKRNALFDDMRKGNIRILIGSTFKLGLGVNVQDKLVALHHLDVPWRPADVGRILRTFKIKKNVEVTDNGKIII
ncbi:MAG: DEAD/DEAH box helicase family protein [Ruminococcus sp.]|nr:DEAD/DEAH box helicase family protein [Ruminococcus sp.]